MFEIPRIAKFEKVSFEQYLKDFMDTYDYHILVGAGLLPYRMYGRYDSTAIESIIRKIYDSIELPTRATVGSAGHDFHMPFKITIPIEEAVKIPTGIRCNIDNGWVLNLYPRSSHGFKYGVHLANSVGVVDSDYYNSDNEGHIFVKLLNDSAIARPVTIAAGEAFCQGIFLPFGITYDDNTTGIRNGGFGSTSK